MAVTFVTISQAIEALLTLAKPYDLGETEVELLRALPSSMSLVKREQNPSAFVSTAKLLERLVDEGKRREDDETAETAYYILYQLYTRIVTPHRSSELSELRRRFMESSLVTNVGDPAFPDLFDETTDEDVIAGFAARLARNIRLEGVTAPLRFSGLQHETQSGQLIIQVMAKEVGEAALSAEIPVVTNAASLLAYLSRFQIHPPLNRVEIQFNHHGTILIAEKNRERWGITPETFGPLAIGLLRRLFAFEGKAEWIYDAENQTGTVRLFSPPEEGVFLKTYFPLDVEQTLSLCPDLQDLNLEDKTVFIRTDSGRVIAGFLNYNNHIAKEIVVATTPYGGRALGVVEKNKKQVVGAYIGHSTRLTTEERDRMLRSLELTVHHVGHFDRLVLIYGAYEEDGKYASDYFERDPEMGRFSYMGSDQPVHFSFTTAPFPLLSEDFRFTPKEEIKGVESTEAPLPAVARVMEPNLAAYLMAILPDVLFPEGEMRHPPFIGGEGVSADGKILFLDLDGGYPTMPIFWAVAANPLIRSWYPRLERIRIQRVHTRGMYPFGFLSMPVRGSTAYPAEFDRVDAQGKALAPSLFNNPAFDLGKHLAEKIKEEGGYLEISSCQLVPNHHGTTAIIELASLPVVSDSSPFLPVDLAHYFSSPRVRTQLPFLGEVEICCHGKVLYRFVWQQIAEREQISAIPFGMTQIPWRLATWESARVRRHPAGDSDDTLWTGFVMDRLHTSTLHRAVVDEVVHALQWKDLDIPIQPKDVHVSRVSSKDKDGFVLRVVVGAPLGISQFELEERWGGRIFRHPFDSLFRMEAGLLQGIDLFSVRAVDGEPQHVSTYVAAGVSMLEDNTVLRVGRFFERTSPFDAQTMYVPPRRHQYLPFDTDLTHDPNHDALVHKKVARLATEAGFTLENLEGFQEDRLIIFLKAGSLSALRERLADRQTDNLKNPLSFHTFLNHAMGGIHSYAEGMLFTEPGATTGLLFESVGGHYFYSRPVGFHSPPTNGGAPAPRPSTSHLKVVEGNGEERPTHRATRRHPSPHRFTVVSHAFSPVVAGAEVMATGEIAIDFIRQTL